MAENDSYQNPATAADAAEPSTAENGWHSTTQGGLTTPIAPEGGIPAYPGNMNGSGNNNNDYGISLPIAPEGGIPAYPGNMNGSGNNNNDYGISLPIAPEGGIPAYPGWTVGGPNNNVNIPAFPNLPGGTTTICPGNLCSLFPSSAYGQVRFIDASTNTIPVNFSIDGVMYASNFMFSHVSNYQQISDGFHTVSVNRSTGMQALLLQQTFPFTANQKVTMVLVDAKEGGLELIQIADTGCTNLPSGYGCYRAVNVSYSDSNFDVKLGNGDIIFRNLGFTQASSYKRAMAGTYSVFVTNANFYSVIRELPVIIIGAITGTNTVTSPLTSSNINIQAGVRTTSYIMGNSWSGYSLRMITVTD